MKTQCIKNEYVVGLLFFQTLGKYKNVEAYVGYNRDWSNYIMVVSNSTRKQDHSGFGFQLELFGLFVYISIYDGRKWNYELNEWVQ